MSSIAYPIRHEKGRFLEYPFPLDDESVAVLKLPREGLTRAEADRLAAYVQTLVSDAAREGEAVSPTGRADG